VVVPGVLIGIPCALAAATLVRSQRYGLAPNDLARIIAAAAVFTLTGFVAALLPAPARVEDRSVWMRSARSEGGRDMSGNKPVAESVRAALLNEELGIV
jgi:hypothetical protein